MTDFVWPSDIDRAENGELQRVCEFLEETLEDRNALIAHFQLLQDQLAYWINVAKPGPNATKESYNSWLALGYHHSSMTNTPMQSLASRDAQMKAVALEEVALRADPANRDWLKAMASHYRQQARDTAP